MKKLFATAALVALLAAPAPATAQAQAPNPAPIPTPTPVPAQEAPTASPPATTAAALQAVKAKPAKHVGRRVPSTADARVCLEFPTQMQIVKCSEKYRWEQASSE